MVRRLSGNLLGNLLCHEEQFSYQRGVTSTNFSSSGKSLFKMTAFIKPVTGMHIPSILL